MTKQELIAKVSKLIKTPATKDGTYLTDWIEDGDTDDMTPQEIATEWDELPEDLTDEQSELVELTGNTSWADVKEWLGGKSLKGIRAEVDKCWPHEDNNAEFSERLFEALN